MEQSNKKVWLSVVAVVVLGFAGYRLFFRSTEAYSYPDRFTGHGVCLACGQESTIEYPAMSQPPYECQGCGEKTVYLWWFCDDCRYRFIPDLVPGKPGEPPKPNPYPVCTHCRCMHITSWDPDNPYQAPEGDAPLPKWPQ